MTTAKAWLQEYWYVPLVVLGLGGFFWWQSRQSVAIEPAPAASSVSVSSTTASSMSSEPPKSGFVHIKGAVANPGLYPVTGTTRWQAVVEAAGGLTADADVTAINLAKIAVDQESLYIPVQGEAAPATTGAGAASPAASSTALVNLNTASEAELQTLSGIGPAKAADIIAYRETSGGFKSVEDLMNVSGIGEKTYERLAPLVTVGP